MWHTGRRLPVIVVVVVVVVVTFPFDSATRTTCCCCVDFYISGSMRSESAVICEVH